ncbi:MAG: gephyrin-like molybdotransferase Glp [Hyphomicrobiaceae bacterium]
MDAPLSVDDAMAHILAGVIPLPAETIAIETARGRILAADLAAKLTQPPFDASAMDGYATRAVDVATLPATLNVIGESAAGHPFGGRVGPGQAVRIFTGAPVPDGTDAIVIQENTERLGDRVVVRPGTVDLGHIRRRGFDFTSGAILLDAGRKLGPRELSLAAAMGHGRVAVYRKPRVAVLSTGDELVMPGETPGVGQIVSSNHLGIAALAEIAGADVIQLGIARDTREDLSAHVERAAGADILVTIGGASVGDHDLVAPVLEGRGMRLAFWKIAMRPGKPLMYGSLGPMRVVGLPGNPVSALVCMRVFAVPLIHALAGVPPTSNASTATARAAVALGANGPRQHYMRGTLKRAADGSLEVTPVRSQDSSLLSPLAVADCLLIRPPNGSAVPAGGSVPILRLDF